MTSLESFVPSARIFIHKDLNDKKGRFQSRNHRFQMPMDNNLPEQILENRYAFQKVSVGSRDVYFQKRSFRNILRNICFRVPDTCNQK